MIFFSLSLVFYYGRDLAIIIKKIRFKRRLIFFRVCLVLARYTAFIPHDLSGNLLFLKKKILQGTSSQRHRVGWLVGLRTRAEQSVPNFLSLGLLDGLLLCVSFRSSAFWNGLAALCTENSKGAQFDVCFGNPLHRLILILNYFKKVDLLEPKTFQVPDVSGWVEEMFKNYSTYVGLKLGRFSSVLIY